MTIRSTLTRGAAGLAAVAMIAGLAVVPTTASAQPYSPGASGYDGGYRYDACQRERTGRGTGGALVGAGIGALAGGNIAARGNRTEGAVLGGLLGAVIGANVGKTAAACEPGQPDSYQQGYAAPPVQDGYYGYDDGRSGYAQGGYAQGAYDPRYGDDDSYGYSDGYARPVADAPSADNCSLAESPIYLPDGRVQKRFVRVCRDSSGRYQVVD
jgi:hypothetical protein